MIPVKLSLHNFMCYRNPPSLSFNGIHTACISGDNGNGKSALIDAITWVLWGKARAKGAGADNDLVHQNENEMAVDFEFNIGEQLYRVVRRYARPKKASGTGQSLLDFQIWSGDLFRSIAGNSNTQTDEKIRAVIHMDYETFINSAFVRQGHAGEFTNQPAGKRKEVLANILGLSVYDDLEERARSKTRELESQIALTSNIISEINQELPTRADWQASLERSTAELTELEVVINEKESLLYKLKQTRDDLQNRKWLLNQLNEKITVLKKELKRVNEQMELNRARVKNFEDLINRASEIESAFLQYCETREQCNINNRKSIEFMKLNERKQQLALEIEKARASEQANRALALRNVQELEAKSQKLPQLVLDRQGVTESENALQKMESDITSAKNNREKLKDGISALEAEQKKLEKEIIEINNKLDLLGNEAESWCPLCEQELDEEHRLRIKTKYNFEKNACEVRHTEIFKEIAQKKAVIQSLEKNLAQNEIKLNRERISLHTRVGLLDKEILEANEAASSLVAARDKLEAIEQQYLDLVQPRRESLAALEKEITDLGYNRQASLETQQQLTQLEKNVEPKRQLDEAIRQGDQERSSLQKLEELVLGLHSDIEKDDKQKQDLARELVAFDGVLNDLSKVEMEFRKLTDDRSKKQQTVWSIKEKLQNLQELEQKKKGKELELSHMVEEQGIYKELAQAFGKKGIQAMLIETAIPEIEIDANRILGRMTDNRMHIKFETQKETKKGDTAEILDINISDELGSRSYEMFSGGEAFRIDFSIRIALSHLLARRAGAPLRTLIIDEGFGTQDSAGLEKVREAINSVQNDFDKIIIITHIDELKDAFPVRIDVIKTPEGSTFSLS